jgi:aminoglycoside phosphotransferase (APT) family kinase protein
MWELTAGNALDYLREQGRLAEGPARVEVLAGGVSNVVLRVEQGGRRFVLKQSRPQLRTREAWFSDVARVYREQDVMEVLSPLLPPGAIPAVLFADRPRYLLAMEHAPLEARVWKAQLLAGAVDCSTAERAGRLLGMIHDRTANKPELRDRLSERTVFVQLRIEPFYRRIQERHPDLAGRIEPLVGQLLSAEEALCHGDFSPKNLLVHSGGVTLVDHETGHLGEPAMDLGFFFSHLLLKGVRSGDWGLYRPLIEAAWRGYAEEIHYGSPTETMRRGFGHLGVCLLARIDGTSPVDYLHEEPKRGQARRLGRGLLLDPPGGWEEVLARL